MSRAPTRRRSRFAAVCRLVILLTLPAATALAWNARPAAIREIAPGVEPGVLAVSVLTVGLLLSRRRRRPRPDVTDTAPSCAPSTEVPAHAPSGTPDVGYEPQAGPPYTVHFNHEARTPMTAILGYAEMLAAPEATPAERVDFLEAVRRNCQSLLRLADETLAFARLDVDDVVVRREPVAVLDLLDEPLLMVRPEAAARQLSIATSASGRMPDSIETDAFHVRQIVTHLLRAAVALSSTGPVQVALRFRSEAGDTPSGIEIDVHDSHAGLTPALRTALFDPWHNSTLEYVDVLGGAGLRLAIARRLAENVGGTLAPGPSTSAGGSFRFSLPCSPTPDTTWCDGKTFFAQPSERPRTDQTYPLEGRVLVVESTSEIAWLVRAMVAQRGVEVEACPAAADAWDRVLAETNLDRPWSAVIVDVDDPNVDGPLLIQRFLLDELTIPVVAVGAPGVLPEHQSSVTLLPKPARGLDLYGAIRPHLHGTA